MSDGSKDLATVDTVFGFFYDLVHSARRNQRAPFSDDTEFYLVNLLVGFLRSQELFRPEGARADDVPLAIRLREAQLSASSEKVRELKHVGDYTLYMSGYFADSLRRRLVDVDYYIALGGAAYRALSRAVGGRRGDPFRPVFDELSQHFPACVEVLSEVSEGSRGATNRDVLAMYEAWLTHQSERTRRRLEELGVLPAFGTPRKVLKESIH